MIFKKQIIIAIFLFAGISFKGFAQASFTMDVAAGCAPLCTNFSDQSTGGLSWDWDFGDASGHSTVANPTHCYVNPGSYTITLTETFSSGTGTATGVLNVYANPVASFTYTNNGNVVTFIDQSSNAASWDWYFGDATAQSTLQNPVHTYANAGNYNAFLVVTSSMGCVDSETVSVFPTAIDDSATANNNWNVYPNPSNGQVSIHFNSPMKNQELLKIENVLGETILSEEISADTTFDLSTHAAGIYFVRIGNSIAKKIVIE